jgi:hypothetical protein
MHKQLVFRPFGSPILSGQPYCSAQPKTGGCFFRMTDNPIIENKVGPSILQTAKTATVQPSGIATLQQTLRPKQFYHLLSIVYAALHYSNQHCIYEQPAKLKL